MKPSYVVGETTPPLFNMTIGEALERAASNWPAGEALVCPAQGARLTWRDLDRRAGEIAAGFLARGLKPGERVGIWSLNRLEWVLTQFACAKAGLILVTVNPAYRLSELEYALTKVDMNAIVISPPFKTSDYGGMILTLAPELATSSPGQLRSGRLPFLRLVVQMGEELIPGALSFAALEQEGRAAGAEALRAVAAGLRPSDPVNIQFTSGTTGAPKGVALSHHNILNNGYMIGGYLGLAPDQRFCVPVPLYHCFGMVVGNLACLTHGAAIVLPGEGFDPLVTLQTLADERCTVVNGVPTMFIAELEHPRFAEFDLSSMRSGIMGGSPCPIEVMRKVISQMHAPDMTIGYGMTETSPASFQTSPDDPLERRVSTIGRVHPHAEAKIIDTATGAIVPCGTPGELCVRGYAVMLGYWNDEAQTAKAIDAEGWMHTGDLAVLDEDGYCQIVGRIKDMVIRGGENLYPREIEEYLYTHPKIMDIQVFGVPDERYGEELCAWVILREGQEMNAEELRAFCRGQIAHHKIPRYVKFVAEMPTTVTGKIQKFRMREMMVEELAAIGLTG